MSDEIQELRERIKNSLNTLSSDDLVVVEVDFSNLCATTENIVMYCNQLNDMLKEFKDKGFNFLILPKAPQFPEINFLPLKKLLEASDTES